MPENFLLVALINLVCTAYMTGVIFTVQLVSYPLYKKINPKDFPSYQSSHIQRITPVVGPVMIVELFSSLFLVTANYSYLSQQEILRPYLIALVLVVLIWLTTLSYSIPLHQNLKTKWDEKLYKKLLETNWTRTVAWLLRCVILSWALLQLLSA